MNFDLNNIHVRLPGGATFSMAAISHGTEMTTHEVAVIASNGSFVPVSEWCNDRRDNGHDVLAISATADALVEALNKAILWSEKALVA